jgi:hypothetical protein
LRWSRSCRKHGRSPCRRIKPALTGHRDSNQEAVRRGFIACRLFPTRSPPPPSGNVMDEIEPNPRGITRSEVEQAVDEWCQTQKNE